FSSCPSRKFSKNTSARASSRCIVSRSSDFVKSSTTLRLPRLNNGKNEVPMPPRLRVLSSVGGSTLITSAPSCARIMPQVGPITIWVISTTLTPSRGKPVSVIVTSRTLYQTLPRLGRPAPSEKYNLANRTTSVLGRPHGFAPASPSLAEPGAHVYLLRGSSQRT